MPGDSELPVAVPNGIDGSVTNKLTYAVLDGSAAYPMKYPDWYTMIFYSYLAVALHRVECGFRLSCKLFLFLCSRDPSLNAAQGSWSLSRGVKIMWILTGYLSAVGVPSRSSPGLSIFGW